MKRAKSSEPTSADFARAGEELRDAREAIGLSLEALAARLRIRRVYLAALEEGRVRDIPAPAYVVGFARAYARAVGLDEDQVARCFRDGSFGAAAVAAPARKADLVFPEPVPERGVPAGAVMLAGAVLMVGAYVGWYHWSGGGARTVDAVPPPPPRLERLAAEGRGGGPDLPNPVPAPMPPTSAAAATAPSLGSLAASRAPGVPLPAPPAPPSPPAVAAAEPAPAAPPPGEGGRLLLRARAAEVWIQVRERAGGPIMVDRVLRPGDSWEAPALRQGMVLATGNAAALEVTFGAEAPIGLGPGPSVRRNVPLDPERLRTAATASAVTPAAATGR